MNCEKIKARLSAYIDGEVAEKDITLIREHIAVCADCDQEEQLLRKTSELLKHWENVRAPDGFCEALLAKAEDLSRRPRRSIANAVRPLAGPRALAKVAFYGAAVLFLCVVVIFSVKSPWKRASMVEPLPTQTKLVYQKTDDDIQVVEVLPRYTTMAEVKVAGIWK